MTLTTRQYKSESFASRIQMNLADVSGNPSDEFRLVTAYYDPATFDCELCGHRNCLYAYEVKNLETEKILKVGSECIHHFKDKGVDINLAEGLMKRVISATNKSRKELVHSLGQEAYDDLSDEDKAEIKPWYIWHWIEDNGKELYGEIDKVTKRDMIIQQFMIIQAKELLYSVSYNKYYLDEDETAKIIELGLDKELQNAEQRRAKYS